MASVRQIFRLRNARRERSRLDNLPLGPLLILALGLGGVAVFGAQETGLSRWLLNEPGAVSAAYQHSFSVCSGRVRHNCVVDGDTFWLEGEKIRIADINTPEVSQPECASEAALGHQATQRLAELLSASAFSLRSIDRDEDQYGRKLRIVESDGRSVGKVLVAEGLAHEWRGSRESWC